MELAVGIMLIGLGLHVLWRLWRDRVHFHRHRHGDGAIHIHAHSHAGDTQPHDPARHEHEHGFVGVRCGRLVHGMAGSAALLVLAVSQAADPFVGLGYVLVFGIGSMVGMGALSSVIAVPFSLTARRLTLLNRGLQLAVGSVTIAIGALTVFRTMLE